MPPAAAKHTGQAQGAGREQNHGRRLRRGVGETRAIGAGGSGACKIHRQRVAAERISEVGAAAKLAKPGESGIGEDHGEVDRVHGHDVRDRESAAIEVGCVGIK